jgi:hypothetical protein
MEAEADVSRANSQSSIADAVHALTAGKEKQFAISQQSNKILGNQIAAIGGAGLGQTGSPMSTIIDSQATAERDMQAVGWTSHVQAAAKLYESRIHEWEAEMKHKQAVYTQWYSWFVGSPAAAMAGASSMGGSAAGTGN